MKVLFVGPLLFGSTTIQRYFSMKKLKLHLNSVNTINTEKLNFFFSLYYNILEKIGFPKDLSNANKNIIKKIKKFRPDILWLDKSITITANTLSSVREICKKIKIIGYSPDYMSRFVNTSHFFNKSLKYYDAFFTTKSYGVKEIKKLGAKKVFFVNNSFDSYTHKKIYLTNKQKSEFYSPVGFIGTWEKQRAEYIYEIAASGFLVKWWGSVSNRHLLLEKFYSHPNLVKYNYPLIDKKYTKALNSFDIALCFLRKDNKDLQTTRSVEIPACGSFMLAERTEEHLKLFQEGKEAEFFSSKNELLGKIRYYLKNPKERIRIAEAGKKRCKISGYSNYKVIYKMIKLVTR
jgi:spore maturation protein CgeB